MTPLYEAVLHDSDGTDKVPSPTTFFSYYWGQLSNHKQNSQGEKIQTNQ